MSLYEKTGYLNSEFKMFHLFDNGLEEFNFHYHDFQKIILFINGNVSYCIEGKSYALKPYDVILVGSGEIHKPIINDSSTYERIIIYVSTNFVNSYKEKSYDLNYCFEKVKSENSNVLRLESLKSSKLFKVFKELENSYNDYEYANELYRKILFLEFMIQLNRAAMNNNISYIETYESNITISRVIEFIHNHITENLSIDIISKSLFLNKYYLMHLFKSETGYTIGNYITSKRLLHAKSMIENNIPVTTACYECGFNSYSAFSRAYKKQFGVSAKNN